MPTPLEVFLADKAAGKYDDEKEKYSSHLQEPEKPGPKYDYQSVEGLKRHPLWSQLTTRQQNFVLFYIEHDGDRIAAAKLAYRPKGDKSADGMAHRLLKVFPIRKLLSIYFGYEIEGSPLSRSEMILLLSDRLRSTDCADREWHNLAAMYLGLKGWKIRPAPVKKVKEPEVVEAEKAVEENLDDVVLRLEREQANEE